MLTMELLLNAVWVLIALKNISQVGTRCVRVFIDQFWSMFKRVESLALTLFRGNSNLKLSSGPNFTVNWPRFKNSLFATLAQLDVEKHLKNEIDNSNSLMIRHRLYLGFENLISLFNQSLETVLEHYLKTYADEEINSISVNLKSKFFFNLSKNPVSPTLIKQLSLGRKFNPFFNVDPDQELKQFDKEIFNILSVFTFGYKKFTKCKNVFNLFSFLINTPKFKNDPLKLKTISSIFKSFKSTRAAFRNFLDKCSVNHSMETEAAFHQNFTLTNGQIIVSADKNLGFVCMDIDDLLHQYIKINEQQHFGKMDIDEETYLTFILNFIKSAGSSIPHELSLILKPSDFVWQEKEAAIGVLRLMPKILKMNTISRSGLPSLKSRGIKSALKDPIRMLQKSLDKIYSHLLNELECAFTRRFNILSPSVSGVDEAITRTQSSSTGSWGNSVELEGDFGDLYSNCNVNLLLSCLKRACKIAKFSNFSFLYIKQLVVCSMTHSYFKEPSGIFRTLMGFSMGDCSAARGSEIILRVYEFDIWKKLFFLKMHKNVHRYLRFRDDVSIHVSGPNNVIGSILKIIITGYPKELQFNVETNVIWGKFLNIRIYNNPNSTSPYTTILRKDNFKYDIIPVNSNVNEHFKMMAGLAYFRNTRTHTTTKVEQRNQNRIVSAILQLKGFSKSKIKKMRLFRTTQRTESPIKKFLGTTIFDKISLRHTYVKKVIKRSSLDLSYYYTPMDIPGPKLEQFVFTIKKMRKLLNF